MYVTIELLPGLFAECLVVRELALRQRSVVELLIFNPISRELEYVYDQLR